MATLLNQFKTGIAASTLRGSRDSVVVRKARSLRRSESLQVRATTSAGGAGWSQSASSKIGKVGSYVDEKLRGQASTDRSSEIVKYKGTAVLMKKLKLLDLTDRVADAQDDASEILRGKKVTVQLMSNEIDQNETGEASLSSEVSIEGWVTIFEPLTAGNLSFDLEFAVPNTFGVPGAIIVRNNHPNEFLLVSFALELPDKSMAHYITNSWVYNTQNSGPRIFFRNKAYLPKDTPEALKELREKELQELRGDGTGERKESDRIYDYAPYNDLGKPDEDPKMARPPLGGSAEFPFPRRIRTGRPPTKTCPKTESRNVSSFYIPRDERFDYIKFSDNKADLVRASAHAIPSKIAAKFSKKTSFESIEEVKKLYAPKGKHVGGINNVLPKKADVSTSDQHPLVFLNELTAPTAVGEKNNILLFPLPQILQGVPSR
jgi:lipoxygenase